MVPKVEMTLKSALAAAGYQPSTGRAAGSEDPRIFPWQRSGWLEGLTQQDAAQRRFG
jgi:hypothetical protein